MPMTQAGGADDPILPRGHTAIVLAVCFVGTHVPLIALALYAASMLDDGLGAHRDLLMVVIAATLAGTALTLVTVYQALRGRLDPRSAEPVVD